MGSSVSPVFKTCGVEIRLDGIDLPDTITITHSLPKEFQDYSKQREDGITCDVIVKVGENTLDVHKALLCAQIPYFNCLFNSNMTECAKGEINISSQLCEFNMVTFELLIEYAYTGILIISTTNVQDLMLGAVFLGIDSIIDECAEFMRKRLRVDNVLPLFLFCKSIAFNKIDSFLLSFIDLNFVPLSLTDEFHELDIEILVAIIQRNSLRVDDEKQVFDAVNRWISRNEDRKEYAARLLECIHCVYLRETFLTETMEKIDWVMDSEECIVQLNKAKEKIPELRMQGKFPECSKTDRFCEEEHRIFISLKLDWSDEKEKEINIRLYDPMRNIWTDCSDYYLPESLCKYIYFSNVTAKIYFSRTFTGMDVFAIFDTTMNVMHTDKEEVIKNIDSFASVFPVKRSKCEAGICIYGKSYSAGGRDDNGNSLADMFTFDQTTKEWIVLSSMSRARAYATAAHDMDGNIYVIGGRLDPEFECLNVVERYDPVSDSWTTIKSMEFKRQNAEAVVLNGFIYVIGGIDDEDKVLSAVERYDPVSNTWTTLKNMSRGRAQFSVGVSCGKIFVFGGCVNWGEWAFTKSVEMYDPETDTWVPREPMASIEHVCFMLCIPDSLPSSLPHLEGIWISGFRNFNLKDNLFKTLIEENVMNPTEVQSECIPQAILGMDVMCQAKSGMGKTSSFIIATLNQLEPVDREISVLVLCKSRKNAAKIAKEYERFSKNHLQIKTAVLLGGFSNKDNSVLANECPQIAIGKPFRILYLIASGALKIDKVKHIIVDECDKIIDYPGMSYAVKKIFKSAPQNKQVLISSSSQSEKVNKLCEKLMRKDPHRFDYTDQ